MLIDRSNLVGAPLRGRVALVTGAGRGIGRETARALARVGATVVVAEISDHGADTVETIRGDGGTAIFLRTDVGDRAGMAALANGIRTTVGGPDIVVNNAAAFVIKPLVEQEPEDWDRQVAVNLGGAFMAARLFVPGMLERGSGVFVVLGSAEGMPYLAPYSATKTALRSLSASLAAEVGPESGVSAYIFSPGMVDTPGGRFAFERIARLNDLTLENFIAASAPGGRLASAEASATGLVGTILNAPDFHGLETDYVTGLRLVGLDADGQPLQDAPAAPPITELRRPDASAAAKNRAVEAILETMISEIAAASMFARPMLRRGFRAATGMGVEDFLAKARAITDALEAGMLSEVSARAYASDLSRLGALIDQQTGMFRGWERDPAKLEAGLAALATRRATVDDAGSALAGLLAARA